MSSPYYDTAIRPLTLSHLCAIFERIGKIPEKPKTIHRKVVSLLLEDWDEQRHIVRNSKYNNFEIDRKLEFLANFSFLLTSKYQKSIFSKEEIKQVYLSIFPNFGLPEKDFKNVIKEIETHTGILICIAQDEYEFTHKSTQEYLTAEYLVRLPNIPNTLRLITKLPNEIAITVSLSSSPSLYISSLLFDRIFPSVGKFFKSKDDLKKISLKKNKINQKFFITIDELQAFLNTLIYRLLIEKPDFPPVPLTTISFLFINSILHNKNDYISNANKMLENYCSLDSIKNHYDINTKSESGKIYLKKKDSVSILNESIPNCLVINESQLIFLKDGN